ncbi:serine/threonine-protein kinase Rad53p [[Candida] anglica]|uniref:Serine/threonine-protein kinase RAD53 n=1 Tax=[Candida] anglica TaxID=148631 RepID=A0ABP0EJD5_9ASCO
MESTQLTQTQPTQQSPLAEDGSLGLEKNIICRLICTTGQYNFFDLNIDKPSKVWVFGRNQDCDVVLTSCTRLSNRHFKLWFNQENTTVWIQDTSTNGTHLNNHRLVKGSNYILNQGDEIAVGVGVPKDIVKFVVLFADGYNPSKSSSANGTVATEDQGIYKDFIVKNEIIGQGAFATVKKVIERSTGESYAVKIINRRKALNANGAAGGVDRELSILRKLNHPNIVHLKSFYEDMDNYYLVMEFVPGGDLMDFVAANGAIGEDATQVITKQILDGIAYVHKLGISHRDLKPDNVLIMQDNPILIKITDFGLAKISDNVTFMKSFCGTLAYLAPEVISGKYEPQDHSRHSSYSCLVDIWSLGCLVYVLLTTHLPFSGRTQDQMFKKIQSGEYHESPLNSYKISEKARDFLSCCLQVNPRLRFSASEALKHPWLSEIEESQDSDSQAISLSQSQSQQSRKVDGGGVFNMSMSKLDEDIMVRPLESDKSKKQEFKIPKRVVPLPQSQQPASQLSNKKSQDSRDDSLGVPHPIKELDVENDDDDEGSESKSNSAELQLSSDDSPDLNFPLSSKGRIIKQRKRSLEGQNSPERKKIKPEMVSVAKLSISQSVPQTSNVWRNTSHIMQSDKNETVAKRSDDNESVPIDTFILLKPLPHSITQKAICIRQGINPFAIGRNETCDIFINDDRMSKIHCLFNKKRHPVVEISIFESPAQGLDDIWLLDCSTNSCFVNGVILGKNRKVQLFNDDVLDFFNDARTHESMSFKVEIVDSTGLFNGGERLKEMDGRFVNVLKQDASDISLRPRVVTESMAPVDYSAIQSSGRNIVPIVASKRTGNTSQSIISTGGNFNSKIRQQRKLYESKANKSPQKSQVSQAKRADLLVDQERPTNSWMG